MNRKKFEEILQESEAEGFSSVASSATVYLGLILGELKDKMDMLDFLRFKRYLQTTLTKYGNEIITSIRRAMTKGCGFSGLTKKQIKKIVGTNWSGKTFSERVWGHQAQLQARVEKEVLNIVLGVSDKETAIKNIAKRFGVSESNARRLITTETAFAMNEAIGVKAQEEGYTKYQFVAVLDNRTSDICRSLNGKIFSFAEKQIGVNYPPLHPNERSTIRPIK